MKSYSLFIGRYQPFHLGHKALMEVALNEGKNVMIGLLEREKSETDPYSYEERVEKINEAMGEWEGRYKIIEIGNVNEVCWGRTVGWTPREIRLDKEIENISATKIRANKNKSHLKG